MRCDTAGMAKPKAKGRAHEYWKDEPEEHDYPAAQDYLSLSFTDPVAAEIVEALQSSTMTHRKAKDLLRAARLQLLPRDDSEVAKDLRRIAAGEALSPVLLVRGAPLLVADGYHRICASYYIAEDADIPCRLVDAP